MPFLMPSSVRKVLPNVQEPKRLPTRSNSGQILQNARKEAKMTQSEQVERTQTTKSYISKIENGVIPPVLVYSTVSLLLSE